MTKLALQQTRLNFGRRRIVEQVMVTVVDDILVVATIIKAMGTMNKTNLELQTLHALLTMEVTVLM